METYRQWDMEENEIHVNLVKDNQTLIFKNVPRGLTFSEELSSD